MKHRQESGTHGKLVIGRRMDEMNKWKKRWRTNCGGKFYITDRHEKSGTLGKIVIGRRGEKHKGNFKKFSKAEYVKWTDTYRN
jgi:hypothetical protein